MLPEPCFGEGAETGTRGRVRSPNMKIIAIANQKGGVGKTTTAVNLGAALAEKEQRVLIVDLDPQGNATSAIGMQELEDENLYDTLLGGVSITEKILPTRLPNLFLVPANLDLAGAEVEIARMENHLTRLRETLSILRDDQTFDFILLDCPPSLGILMTNALAAADEILTPIQCEYFALEGLVKIVRVVQQVRDSGANDSIEIGGIVMTMFDSRTNLSSQVVSEVRQHFGERVYQAVIPRTVRLSEAPSFGKTILEYDGKGVGAQAYRALAREFLKRYRLSAKSNDETKRDQTNAEAG
jgi:chromosome partitioning protein